MYLGYIHAAKGAPKFELAIEKVQYALNHIGIAVATTT